MPALIFVCMFNTVNVSINEQTGLEPVVLMAEDRRMYNMWTDGCVNNHDG